MFRLAKVCKLCEKDKSCPDCIVLFFCGLLYLTVNVVCNPVFNRTDDGFVMGSKLFHALFVIVLSHSINVNYLALMYLSECHRQFLVYNYVAQPGDKGVNQRPPHLGVYDAYALAWGYKPIFEAKTPQDEQPVLNRWIREKEGNRMYVYGPQYFFNSVDPSCQSEDLGDNAVKAGTYGINNLKYIMKHLNEWCVEEGKDYQRLQEAYTNLTNQLQTYLYHAVMYVDSIYMDKPVAGDGKRNFRFTDKKIQQEALQFVLKNIYDMPAWLLNKDIINKIGPVVSVTNLQARVLKSLFAKPVSSVMALNEQLEPATAYTYRQYMMDLYNAVWSKSMRGGSPDIYERQLQNVYLSSLLRLLPGKGDGKKAAPQLSANHTA